MTYCGGEADVERGRAEGIRGWAFGGQGATRRRYRAKAVPREMHPGDLHRVDTDAGATRRVAARIPLRRVADDPFDGDRSERLVRRRQVAIPALPRSADRRIRHHAQEHQHLPRRRHHQDHEAEGAALDNVSSIEGILEQLDEARQSVGLIACGEYSYLVATGKRQGTSNIIPVLNHAYDGVDPLTITKKKAPIIVEPFLNLMAGYAGVDRRVRRQGGRRLGPLQPLRSFLRQPSRDISHPEHLTRDEQDRFARRFDESLDRVLRLPGPIEFDADAREEFDEWFIVHRRRLRSLPDNLRKLMEREDDQVQIQAIVYAAADGRRCAGIDDVKAAIALVEWSGTNKLQLFGEVEFNQDQRLERRMQAFIDRGAGPITKLYRDLGNLGNREAVYRKLRAMVALGGCTLSRALDEPSRAPLIIFPPDSSERTVTMSHRGARERRSWQNSTVCPCGALIPACRAIGSDSSDRPYSNRTQPCGRHLRDSARLQTVNIRNRVVLRIVFISSLFSLSRILQTVTYGWLDSRTKCHHDCAASP